MIERENQPEVTEATYDKISPTAWSVAYGRIFSDIPYSQEIFDCLEKQRKLTSQEIPGGKRDREVAAQFEARYKMINKFLAEGGYKQILEIASGLTPRGLQLAKDPNINYVEFDLPPMIAQKEEIIKDMEAGGVVQKPKNLSLVMGNALSAADLETAAGSFQADKPVAIVTEGLLRYFTFEEKAQVARNVLRILKKFGGVWLTPDTQTKDGRFGVSLKNAVQFSKVVGRNIEQNYFSDEAEAIDFFTKLGFDVKSHSLSEALESLVSIKRLGLNEKQIQENVNRRKLFVMKPHIE